MFPVGATMPMAADPGPRESLVGHARAWIAGWLLPRLSRVTSSGRFVPEIDGLRFTWASECGQAPW